jgi:hypothetical protein
MPASFKNWVEHKSKRDKLVRILIDWKKIKEEIHSFVEGDGGYGLMVDSKTGKSIPMIMPKNDRYLFELSQKSGINFQRLKLEYEEFYAIHGFIDYSTFNFLINEFRKQFPKEYRITDVTYYDDLIEKLIWEYEAKESGKMNKDPENPHTEIFVNVFAWELFRKWVELKKNSKADMAYIYWKMTDKTEKLMKDIKPGQYKRFLNKIHINLGTYWKQLYRLETEDNKRGNLYNSLKETYIP